MSSLRELYLLDVTVESAEMLEYSFAPAVTIEGHGHKR